MAVTKLELVDRISEVAGLTKKDTHAAVTAFVDVVTKALSEGEVVNITGFVKITPRVRPARKGRNLQTGETIDVGACNTVSFKAGRSLKDSLNP